MDIQTLFYTLASIFMILGIIFVIGLILLLWKAERSVIEFKKKTVDHISQFVEQKKFVGLISLVGLGIKWLADKRNKQTS